MWAREVKYTVLPAIDLSHALTSILDIYAFFLFIPKSSDSVIALSVTMIRAVAQRT
jgi:hypothetical protein